ncbi:cupin domain-containing protein [Acidithiobacillus sp. IBUN Pt1247-S3]|uniref:cupin domain-containing protein n=1 Tax=Acidithiobacillus sp. IBUN Pt1247-S3 TaxID=3166642 RepID=UPI0034E4B25A
MTTALAKVSDEIGLRLRQVRQIYGLTQRELARRSGVTNGAISLIEQCRVSPSISSLKKILEGIPMSLAEFFTVNLTPSDDVFFCREGLTNIATDAQIVMKLLGGRTNGRSMQIMHEFYAPGADTGEIPLRHTGEEGGFIIRGTIYLTVGDQSSYLHPGDGYYFESQLPHRFTNHGDEECEIFSATTPPGF